MEDDRRIRAALKLFFDSFFSREKGMHFYPFTAPDMKPFSKYFWTKG